MSRVGKQIVEIPNGTEIILADGILTVKGKKGELKKEFKTDIVSVDIKDKEVTFAPKKDSNFAKALWGTYAAHVKNMIKGVTEGFEKKLAVEGVGYKWEVNGKNVKMNLGFSHEVLLAIPEGLNVVTEKSTMTITGIDKELVGLFSAKVRDFKKPEPYKGKGIRYEGEFIRRKQGKKSA
ncbi:MAG: 50S ribosomal protein L6 [Candidatus Paceibacterota bacterium]